MDIETLSNRILDGWLDSLEHGDKPIDDSDSLEHYDPKFTDDSDYLEHYGVLGMKWGVRKDRDGNAKTKRAKKDRRYDDETDQEYQNRMQRESNERSEKVRLKSQERIQKAQLKNQVRLRKLEIQNQKRQKEQEIAERKRQEKVAKDATKEREKVEKTNSKPVSASKLSDKELNDAIQRLRNEKTYKELSLQNRSIQTRTLVKAATIGGGVLLAVGTAVAKKQLTDVGNQKASDYLKKKGWLKENQGNDKSKSKDSSKDFTLDDVRELYEELSKAAKAAKT